MSIPKQSSAFEEDIIIAESLKLKEINDVIKDSKWFIRIAGERSTETEQANITRFYNRLPSWETSRL